MLAYDYPLGGVFLSILYFFLFFIWIWILITVFMDIFRSPDLSGWGKALWSIFVIILPFLGVFIYLIARGGKMQERKLQDAAQQKQAFDSYVRETAGSSGGDVTSQLTQFADLKAQECSPTPSSSRKRPRFWLRADTEGEERAQEEGMKMAEDNGSLGPISYLVVEFPGSKMTGEGLPILVDLVNDGVIRILDLVFVAKGEDGSLGIIALADLDHDGTIDLAVFEGVSSGLVSQEDLADAAPVIAPGLLPPS